MKTKILVNSKDLRAEKLSLHLEKRNLTLISHLGVV